MDRPPAPTTVSRTTFSSSCSSEPQASLQLAYATDTPTEAAAGMVVTEMKTPMRALARDSVRDITPTSPARMATMTENTFGVLMRSATGLTPCRYWAGRVARCLDRQPEQERHHDRRDEPPQQGEQPVPRQRAVADAEAERYVAMIALYSGPTTMAPTMRIWELVRMPTAPISPAMVSRP